MINRFEFVNGNIGPEDRERYEQGFEARIKEKRESLAQRSIEPDPRMAELVSDRKRQYYEEWVSLGGDPNLDVPIYFIPTWVRAEVAQILEIDPLVSSTKWFGVHDPISQAVVVVVDDNKDAMLHTARTLEHELAHAYGYNFILYKVEKDEVGFFLNLRTQAGLTVDTHSSDHLIGAVFEEYYAVERELRGLEKNRALFPQESKNEEAALDRLIAGGTITPAEIMYTSVVDTKLGAERCIVSNYVMTHQVGKYILSKIPNSWDILRKARVSGDWSILSRAVNERFGAEAFKAIVHTDGQDRISCELLERFLMAENEKKKLVLKKEIFMRAGSVQKIQNTPC